MSSIGMYKKIQQKLNAVVSKNLWRSLENIAHKNGKYIIVNNKTYVNFSSNDYLDLNHDPRMISALYTGAEKYGVGAGASQLVTGRSAVFGEFEQEFAKFLGFDKALIFASGFAANVGVISALLTREGIAIADKCNHASIIDGCILSRAKLARYQHINLRHLSDLLHKYQHSQEKLVITESVFSMAGSMAPLAGICALARQHNAIAIIDDAHGIGVLGKNGRGAVDHLHLSSKEVDIVICPLGKAFGLMGAVVVTNNTLYEYFLQFSRSFIYSTGISPALVSAALCALNIIQLSDAKRERLFTLINYFMHQALAKNLPVTKSESHIQNIILYDAQAAINASAQLRQLGFWVTAIRPPTVPAATSRLRITITCAHTMQDIDKLVVALSEVLPKSLSICNTDGCRL